MKKLITICLMTLLFGTGYAMADYWTTIDMPGATSTDLRGIDGSNIVGSYDDTSGTHGFLYNYKRETWTPLDFLPKDIDGSNIIGRIGGVDGHEILYNMTSRTFTILDSLEALEVLDAWSMLAEGIDGDNIVGYYRSEVHGPDYYGFLYNGKTWTAFDAGTGGLAFVQDIDGSNIVGYSVWGGRGCGFLYNWTNQTWTHFHFPVPENVPPDTYAIGISGSNIVGWSSSGNFLYNLTSQTWTTLPGLPGPPEGIDGRNIVGSYGDASGTHGFIYTIPEPATLLLFGLGGLALLRKRRA